MKSLVLHPEFRVVATVLASLLVCEVGIRRYGDRLSKDVAHLAAMRSVADELAPAADGESVRVLFLGNSLTRCGVAPEEFVSEAERSSGQEVAVAKLTPDNTAVADWFYAYRNYFAEAGRAPQVLILGFQAGHLQDAPSNHPQRLARFYCDAGDWPDLCRDDLPTFESRAAFVLASNSALIANRDRIERRALDTLIPGYQDGIQELNSRVQGSRPSAVRQPTYSRLERLLDVAQRDGVRVVLVAMPVLKPYEIDPALRELAAARQAALLDCREVTGITREMFPDGLHMNETAAACYSRHLAHLLDWSAAGPKVASR